MRTLSAALWLCSLAACGGGAPATHTAAGDGRFEIHLARQYAVGARWGEVARFAQEGQRLVRDEHGESVRDERTHTVTELSGVYTVVAVHPARLRLVVERFTVDEGAGPTSPAIPSVLLVEPSSDVPIRGEHGEPLQSALLVHLNEVISARRSPVGDDAIFGTTEPRAVGESWPLDAINVARTFAAFGLTVDPSDVEGETTLVGADRAGGVDALVLRLVFSAHDLRSASLPAGASVTRSDALFQYDMRVPLDPALPALEESMHTGLGLQMSLPTPTGAQTVDASAHQELTRTRTLGP